MINNTHRYLLEKCEKICKIKDKVILFPTALSMLEYSFSGYRLKSIIKQYEDLIGSNAYREANKDFKSITTKQWSLSRYTDMVLYGLATKPKVSVTVEGQSYQSFTMTVFHEFGHMFFGESEILANEFALLNNKRIWNDNTNFNELST